VDFFEAQDRALRRSGRLILLFALAVITMMAIVYATALVVLGFAPLTGFTGAAPSGRLFQPALAAAVVVGMGAVIGGGAAFRTAQLRRGGPAVAELLGGRRVDPATEDPRERVLLNVVEEMAIASGLVVPAVYVLDREPGINAFAAGHAPTDAAVAVTRGALDAFDRDELQGVIGHEFSHILNGDMRLNVRLMGWLFGILLLTVVGRGLLRGSMGGSRSSGGRRGNPAQLAILGVALVLLGYLGVLFGRLIQAAVSRQREFLADAAAVQFTRNPAGLAGALKKVGAAGSRIANHHAAEAGHFFFASGQASGLSRLSATHPPLAERIRRIDRHWDGRFPAPAAASAASAPATPAGPPVHGPRPGPAARPFPFPLPGMPRGGTLPAMAALIGAAGAPSAGHIEYARRLLASVPDPVRTAARTPEGALSVVCALLAGGADDAAAAQARLAYVADALGEPVARQAAALREALAPLGAPVRLPLLELALPALRGLPAERAAALRRTVATLVEGTVPARPFDLALLHLVQRAAQPGRDVRPPRGSVPLARLREEAELVLSLVARATPGPAVEADRAFAAAAEQLADDAGAVALQPESALDVRRLSTALDRLRGGAPAARRALLAAAAAAVGTDARVTLAEVELLRTLAEALDVPVPPLLPDDADAPDVGAAGAPA
jgi:Zn-dependent protease with chaperone function